MGVTTHGRYICHDGPDTVLRRSYFFRLHIAHRMAQQYPRTKRVKLTNPRPLIRFKPNPLLGPGNGNEYYRVRWHNELAYELRLELAGILK